MSNEVVKRHKIGIVRAVKGEISIEEQTEQLIEFGVDPMHIWRTGKDKPEEIASAFRKGNDLLVVSFLGALGNQFDILLGLIGGKGTDLHALNEGLTIPCKGWEHFTTVKRGVMLARTAPGRKAAETGAKVGPKLKLNPEQRKAAKQAWGSKDGSNEDVAADFGVSSVYLNRAFGGRKAAQALANK